jgi:hypothetical protein
MIFAILVKSKTGREYLVDSDSSFFINRLKSGLYQKRNFNFLKRYINTLVK